MWDAAVIGAGFGGLGAALGLAERGARVVTFEALNYPGGCASTFRRGGNAYESGATLSAGLHAGGWFAETFRRHGIPVAVDWPQTVVTQRIGARQWTVGRDRDAFVAALCAEAGAPVPALRRFFDDQGALARLGWSVFERADLLPPWRPTSFARLAAHLAPGARFAGWPGRPMIDVLRRYQLDSYRPLTDWLDATLQVSVQCGLREADAGFGAIVADFWWQGVGHLRGGMGALAQGMVDAVRQAGGEVRLADRVRALRRDGDAWVITTRSGEHRARQVVANLVPGALGTLLGELPATLAPLDQSLRGAWGAAMLYRVVRPPADASPDALHLQLVDDPDAPFTEGNHVFLSISGADDTGRCPPGLRTLTASTHLPLSRLDGAGAAVEAVQSRMRATVARRAPEWETVEELTASPRTFERFTRRTAGAVGGLPRRAGWLPYWQMTRLEPTLPGLWLVGDSVGLGQSTLSTAIGGHRTAAAMARAG